MSVEPEGAGAAGPRGRPRPQAAGVRRAAAAVTVGALSLALVAGAARGGSGGEDWAASLLSLATTQSVPPPVYVAAHFAAILLCFPGAVVFELAAGHTYGFPTAVAMITVAKVAAAAGTLLAVRGVGRAGRGGGERGGGSDDRTRLWRAVERGVQKDGWRFVLLLRLGPLPSFMCNLALAATPVRVADFAFGTALGVLPWASLNAWQGAALDAVLGAAVGAPAPELAIAKAVVPALAMLGSIVALGRYSEEAVERAQATVAHEDEAGLETGKAASAG